MINKYYDTEKYKITAEADRKANVMTYDRRHGGPYDRGSADAYYGRPFNPHYYAGKSYQSQLVEQSAMTIDQLDEYRAGYEEQVQSGDFKQW
jgi:hypothetical protein